LIKSIGALAAENAWFMTEGLSDYGIAGLSCPETAEHVLAILRSPAEPAPLKTLALRAIELGAPLSCYRPELENTLANSAAPASHRRLAFRSLLKYGPDGTASAVRIYRTAISGEGASLGLRSVIVGELYGHPFGAADAVAILMDAATKSPPETIGELWPLVHGIPAQGLLDVLEEYERQSSRLGASSRHRPSIDASLSVGRMVARLYETIPEDDIKSVDRLINVLWRISEEDLSFGGVIRVGEILLGRPHLLGMLVDSAIRHMDELEYPPIVGLKLNRLTGGAVETKAIAERLCAEFDVQDSGSPFSPNVLQRYEAFGRSLYNCGPEASNLLERFIGIGKSRPECGALLETYTKCELHERNLRPGPYEQGVAEYRLKIRQAVEREATVLQRGENPGLQGELAMLYFGFYSGEAEFTRRKQLVLAVGTPLTEATERGFVAMVEGQAPPLLREIAEISAIDQFHRHWYTYLAGLDLRWGKGQDLGGLSRDTLSAAFAISLVLDTPEGEGRHTSVAVREWPKRILCDCPDIAEEAYTSLLAERLRLKVNVRSLLYRLRNEANAPWRGNLALRLLLDHEPKDVNDLQELCLIAAEADHGRQRLVVIAQERVFGSGANRPTEDPFWNVVGFVIGGEHFEAKLTAVASGHPETLWIIRSLTRHARHANSPDGRFDLSLRQMEFIVRTLGPLFPGTASSSAGWGDQNNFEAAHYLNDLIAALSARPGFTAGEALVRLLECQNLISYRPWISSRLTAQREVNRQSRYEKPTWEAVCAALTRGAPANTEDLKALFLADLIDAGLDIRQSNLDKYRIYWSGGSRYALGIPRDEDYCRDRLVDYLRVRLKPLGVWVEPEGHMAADKRADMVILAPNGLKLSVEVKRDTHQDLWTASKTQLERLYTRDPTTRGYGVYLVFYFGPRRGRGITPHPDGVSVIDSPDDLKKALDKSVPAELCNRITCAVIDVSPPASPRSSASKPQRKNAKGTMTKRNTKNSAQGRRGAPPKKNRNARARKEKR
jgi:hypothetical protein